MSEEYTLEESVKSLGKLNPVLVTEKGEVIDGLHRLEKYPDWPQLVVKGIDTVEKLEAARLALNTNRRLVQPSELQLRIGLLAKAGLKADQIAGMTGLGLRTVYKYFPQEMKEPGKVEAGQAGGISAARVHQTVKTQDTTQISGTICDGCGVSTSLPHPWPNGNTEPHLELCPICNARSTAKSEVYQHKLAQKKIPNQLRQRLEQQKAAPPKPTDGIKEKPEFIIGRMHPHDSKFQLAVIQELQKEGLDIQTGLKFDVIISKVTMEPDGVWRMGNGKTAFIFIDGPPHLGQEDEDAELRNLLKEQHGGEICPVPYKADTKEERERAKQEVKDFPKWM